MKLENDYYVIDKDYKLIDFNKNVEERYKGISLGDYCYKATMNREKPCLHCPIAGNAEDECPIYFDPFYNDWVQANFCEISNGLYSVICHPAKQTGIGLFTNEDSERAKKALSGKAANSILKMQIAEQNEIIEGLSRAFYILIIIDLETGLYKKLYTDQTIIDYTSAARGRASTGFDLFIDKKVAIESKDIIREFTNLDTIRQRVDEKQVIFQEFINDDLGWSKAIFIPVERDSKGQVTKVVFGAEDSNDELTDSLTKCGNRRSLDWVNSKSLNRDMSIAVLMCDVNGLKVRNDEEGHESGDKLLCKAVDKLFEYFGRNKVYRIGGDEFIVIDLNISKSAFSEKVLKFKKICEISNINVSVGYEFREKYDIDFDRILEAADQKMYEAKRDYYRKRGINRRNASEQEIISEYIDALVDYGSYAYIVCEMNLTNNSYKVLHIMEGYDTSFMSECKTLEDIFEYPLKKNIVHPEDIPDYKKYINMQSIKGIADENGKRTDNWFRYRSKFNRNDYHLIEVTYFAGRNYSNDNQEGYFFIKDMGMPFNSEKLMFEEILKELSENFESIFYVDFDKDEVIPYRMSTSIIKKQGSSLVRRPTYNYAINTYIDKSVVGADKASMRRVCSRDYLANQLRLKRAFSHDFTTVIDGNEVFYRVKFSNLDGAGELHHCIVGFTNINSEAVSRREFERPGNNLLIIDDEKSDMDILSDILNEEYTLLKAENYDSALGLLKNNYKSIALIVLGLKKNENDGYELIRRIVEDRRYASIPVVVEANPDEELNNQRCYEVGATDIIYKPFSEFEIKNRIRSLVRLRGVTAALNNIEIDELTGLYTKEAFFRYARLLLDNNPEKEYHIMVSDIIGFKAINEQYGKEMGDNVLKYLADMGNDGTNFTIGGRIGSDIFASIAPEMEIDADDQRIYSQKVHDNAPIPNLVVKLGIYSTRNGRDLSIRQMCDRAELALLSIKGQYDVMFAQYNDSMRDSFLVEQFIKDSMLPALREGQFKVYFQPKYNISENKVAGAEALVRWIHPELGFMSPKDFIPLFERNGFITKLDRYVWEKTCEEISAFLDKGIVLPISVNVSRRDFEDSQLADYIIELTNKYMIPHELLQIEVTESAYSDNPTVLNDTIAKLHNSGFIIELDDFGSGYSSITALNSMDIDFLKLDMSIIREDKEENGKSVLEFIMRLARMMNLRVIQEGVETKEQLDRVKSLGCEYVQGYFYSKPLSKDEFDRYIYEHINDLEY